MDIIKSDDFRRELKKGLSGGYLFYGEEDYLKQHMLSSARAALCEDEGFAFFNDMRIDPLDLNASSLLDALAPMPMMSDKKIVSVSGLYISDLKQSTLDDLCEVFSQLADYDYSVLIVSIPSGGIDIGTPKKPSPTFLKLTKHLRPVCFEAPGQAKLLAWCGKHFEHNGVSCSDDIIRMMFDRCGTSMFTLASEIDKISFYLLANGRDTVTPDDVLLVTCSVIEAEAFALSNALLDGKSSKALEALAVMKFNQVDPVKLLAEITGAVCDMAVVKKMLMEGRTAQEIGAALFNNSAYRAKIYMAGAATKSIENIERAVELCAKADRDLKSTSGGYAAIEQLLCSL